MGVTGIDALYKSYSPRKVIHPNGKLHDTAWGTREFAILDRDGNLITFFERKAKPTLHQSKPERVVSRSKMLKN